MKLIPVEDCVCGAVYRIGSRNLVVGVYDGDGGFIGIREKFGERCLFTEYHYNASLTFGTVRAMERLDVDVPEHIPVRDTLGVFCTRCDQPDSGDRSEPCCDQPDLRWKSNTQLFEFLSPLDEAERARK